MRMLLRFSLGLILCLPCLAQDYITVTAPSSCLKDGSGASIASARLTVQAVDTNGRPIPFRIGTGTASALISQVGRDITSGALATSLQLGNPATTAPVNIRYHFAFHDNTTNQNTNWPLVSLVANDSGNFNLCKFDPSNGGVLGPLAPGAYGSVLINPGVDQTITSGSLFMPTSKALGWSDAAVSRDSAHTFDFGNGTPGDVSGVLFGAAFESLISATAKGVLNGFGVAASNDKVIGFSSTANATGTIDVALSRGNPNQINCGNGTPADASCAFFASVISSFNSSTANAALSNNGVKAAANKIIGFSSTNDAVSGSTDAALSRMNSNVVGCGNGTFQNITCEFDVGSLVITKGSSTGGQENALTLQPILNADSTHNYPGPTFRLLSNYWNGSVTSTDTWQLFPLFSAGTNPTSALTLWHFGSSGNAYLDLTNQDTHVALVTTTSIRQPLTTPASSTATCVQNAIEWDASFIYICTATNNWKRVALSTF